MNYYLENTYNKINSSLKIIFAGTPNFAAQHLHALLSLNYNVIAILTQPDRPSNRGQKINSSPVKIIAKNYSIPILQPTLLDSTKIINQLNQFQADIMLVIAYGLIIPEKILNLFPLGCINVHASLLPRWRGPAPIQWTIINGDKETGISIIKMNKGIDTGDILYAMNCTVSSNDTYTSLEKKLILIGIKAILIVLNRYNKEKNILIKQNNINSTYASKINKKQAKLDWYCPAKKLERLVRAFQPWPIAFFSIKDILIKVWNANVIHHNINTKKKIGEIISADRKGLQINTIQGILNITKIQIPNKKIMTVQEFLNSKKNSLLFDTT
ncbi:methionyl-tRNA formyltransferase [Buchnera aphidicola]|uniref:methionyl-tRNA formyltransferase n=1 Tax=Buchnera aphidicola TaxID=9 RepID=UPI0031B87063